MDIKAFQRVFKNLCLSFDLDPEKKKSRVASYFDSKLGELTEEKLLGLIKQARETLDVKKGFLPSVRELIKIYYSTMTKRMPKSFADQENYHDAICNTCGNIGFVTLEHDGYRYSGFPCTCIHGENKLVNTILGRSLGVYTKYLDKGYTVAEMVSRPEEAPF